MNRPVRPSVVAWSAFGHNPEHPEPVAGEVGKLPARLASGLGVVEWSRRGESVVCTTPTVRPMIETGTHTAEKSSPCPRPRNIGQPSSVVAVGEHLRLCTASGDAVVGRRHRTRAARPLDRLALGRRHRDDAVEMGVAVVGEQQLHRLVGHDPAQRPLHHVERGRLVLRPSRARGPAGSRTRPAPPGPASPGRGPPGRCPSRGPCAARCEPAATAAAPTGPPRRRCRPRPGPARSCRAPRGARAPRSARRRPRPAPPRPRRRCERSCPPRLGPPPSPLR